jgi:putative hemolysin
MAATEADVIRCQQLRYLAFIEGRGLNRAGVEDGSGVSGGGTARLDHDEFDPLCHHLMIEETRTGKLVCCFRMLPLNDGADISRCYSAKYYELSKLAAYPGRMVEMGRFCIHPAHRDLNILRVAWAAMSRFIDREGVDLLFGCSSFHGVDAEAYMDAFALLKEKHLAPLVMGGWVSDHAVIDNELNTLHVFTGVEIKRVPPKRARLLRRAGA